MAIGIVKTNLGDAKGVELQGRYEGLTYFKGIPYAKPPVGELRWRPPQDPEGWEGVRCFDTFPPTAYQSWYFNDVEDPHVNDFDFYFSGHTEPMSEDCLYINICTGAQAPGEKRPVYMWFHGGGLNQGYSYEPELDPSEMARKGAVVVMVGQRLNVFGYLVLPQLSEEQGGTSGNYGLMDQIKALDWVYENIEAFGGDPENISVGGESGGSWKACALATCPEAKGRVKKLIGESWINWFMAYMDVKEYEAVCQEFLEHVGVDPNTPMEELRKMDPSVFVHDGDSRHSVPGDMVFDGKYIPFPTQKEAFDNYGGSLDYLGGTNFGIWENSIWNSVRDQQSLYYYGHHSRIHGGGEPVSTVQPDNRERFYAHYKAILGDLYDKYDFENLVQVTDDTAMYTARRLAALGLCPPGKSALSHTLMIHRVFGKYMAQKFPGVKAYAYLFAQPLPKLEGEYGEKFDVDHMLSWHGSELYYAFAAMRENIPPMRKWRGVDYYVADHMSSYWVNFMRTGDPNGYGLEYWPAASDDYGYMELCGAMKGGSGADKGLDALMREYCIRAYEIDM